MNQGHYHFRTKLIARSDGRAICAAAAYRSGEKIRDEHYGKTFDYTPRTSIYATEIRAPDHAPDWMKNRSELWNGVEAFENRKNSRLAREFEISVPCELSPEQRQEAVRRFVDKELVAKGMVADISYHEFTGKKAHNPHAHILVTTREIDGGTFSKKKNREWDKEETLIHWRESWARHANQVLEEAHLDTRIDHRSYRDRGITATPLNESHGAWYIRQHEVQKTHNRLDAVEKEIAAVEKEQAQQYQQRIDAVIQFGNDLARDRTTRKQQQAERQQQRQKEKQQAQQDTKAPSSEPDERHLIEQWQQFKDIERKRGKPRVAGQQSDQASESARGESLAQQTAKLTKSIAAFQTEIEKLEQTQRQPPAKRDSLQREEAPSQQVKPHDPEIQR